MVYRLPRMLDSAVTDSIVFNVSVNRHVIQDNVFVIRYQPSSTAEVDVTNSRLTVIEGESEVITQQHLYVQAIGVRNFTYQVCYNVGFWTLNT